MNRLLIGIGMCVGLFIFGQVHALEPEFTIIKSQSTGGTVQPTWTRLNIWDLAQAKPFSTAYPNHHYKGGLFDEVFLMTATGGRLPVSTEIFKSDGTYDFTRIDNAIKSVKTDSGITPIIVIGNTPEPLSNMPGEKGDFEANIGSPTSYWVYYKYIKALTDHLYTNFGLLRFRLYTEPDNVSWFHEGFESYKRLYDVTLGAMRDALKSKGVIPVLEPGNLVHDRVVSGDGQIMYWGAPMARWMANNYSGKFIDAFNGSLSQWDFLGSGTIVTGEMQISNSRALSKIATNWNNFDLTASMQSIGNGGATWKVGWIIFKYVNDDNYMYLLLHDDGGSLELGRRQNGTNASLAMVSTGLSPQSARQFRIRAFCDTIEAFVDDKRFIKSFVSNSGTGRIGFWAWDGAPNVHVDNVIGKKYLVADNFGTTNGWTKTAGSFSASGNVLTLAASSNALSVGSAFSNYTLRARVKTDNPGPNPWKTGWLIFDYVDDANFSACILHTDGWLQYGYYKAGVFNQSALVWTGSPRPFISEDFDAKYANSMAQISGSAPNFTGGKAQLSGGNIFGGYTSIDFTKEYRLRATLRTVSQGGTNTSNVGQLVFKYVDANNYWGIQVNNDASHTVRVSRWVNGAKTDVWTGTIATGPTQDHAIDLRIGGDVDPGPNVPEHWVTIPNGLTLVIDGVQRFKSIFSGGTEYGRFGVKALGGSVVQLDKVLVTYQGNRRIIPTDEHVFEITSQGSAKSIVIDGVTRYLADQPNAPAGGKVGFWAWDGAANVRVRDVTVSELVPSHAAVVPRFPSGNPEFSLSSYGMLNNPAAREQMGSDPRELSTIMNGFKSKISPFYPSAKYSVAEGEILFDEAGVQLWEGDGTNLGAAWNAAIVKQSLDVSSFRYTQWGYTSDILKSPTYNVFQLYQKMRGNSRIGVSVSNAVSNVEVVAAASGDVVKVLLYYYSSNRANTTVRSPIVKFLSLHGSRAYTAKVFRVDATNSNFFNSKWLPYATSKSINPIAGHSRFDMDILDSYSQPDWNTQKVAWNAQNADELKQMPSISFTTNAVGSASISVGSISPNSVLYYELTPN